MAFRTTSGRGVPSQGRRLCGFAPVDVEHTAETLAAHDAAADGCVVVPRRDELVAEGLMVRSV